MGFVRLSSRRVFMWWGHRVHRSAVRDHCRGCAQAPLTLDLAPGFILCMGRRMSDGLKIGELSLRCGVTPDTVRFYERRGLLPKPRRTAAQYRVYTDVDEQRLRFIRQAQEWGLSLEDIREMLRLHELRSPDECRRVAVRLRERLSAIDRMIAELTTFRHRIADNVRKCEGARADTCPVVVDLFGRRSRRAKETDK